MSLVTTLLLVQISYVQRDFETAMAAKDQGNPLLPHTRDPTPFFKTAKIDYV